MRNAVLKEILKNAEAKAKRETLIDIYRSIVKQVAIVDDARTGHIHYLAPYNSLLKFSIQLFFTFMI